MTQQEAQEFRSYLKQCTDIQVIGVWEKERKAERHDFAALAEAEMEIRSQRESHP